MEKYCSTNICWNSPLYSPAHRLQLLQPLDLLLRPLPFPLMKLDRALCLNHRPMRKTESRTKMGWLRSTLEQRIKITWMVSVSIGIFSWMQLNLSLESALILLKGHLYQAARSAAEWNWVLVRAMHANNPLFCISSICFTGTLGWWLWIRDAVRDGALQSKTMFVGVLQIPAELWHRVPLCWLHGFSTLVECLLLPNEGRIEELNSRCLLRKKKKRKKSARNLERNLIVLSLTEGFRNSCKIHILDYRTNSSVHLDVWCVTNSARIWDLMYRNHLPFSFSIFIKKYLSKTRRSKSQSAVLHETRAEIDDIHRLFNHTNTPS